MSTCKVRLSGSYLRQSRGTSFKRVQVVEQVFDNLLGCPSDTSRWTRTDERPRLYRTSATPSRAGVCWSCLRQLVHGRDLDTEDCGSRHRAGRLGRLGPKRLDAIDGRGSSVCQPRRVTLLAAPRRGVRLAPTIQEGESQDQGIAGGPSRRSPLETGLHRPGH